MHELYTSTNMGQEISNLPSTLSDDIVNFFLQIIGAIMTLVHYTPLLLGVLLVWIWVARNGEALAHAVMTLCSVLLGFFIQFLENLVRTTKQAILQFQIWATSEGTFLNGVVFCAIVLLIIFMVAAKLWMDEQYKR